MARLISPDYPFILRYKYYGSKKIYVRSPSDDTDPFFPEWESLRLLYTPIDGTLFFKMMGTKTLGGAPKYWPALLVDLFDWLMDSTGWDSYISPVTRTVNRGMEVGVTLMRVTSRARRMAKLYGPRESCVGRSKLYGLKECSAEALIRFIPPFSMGMPEALVPASLIAWPLAEILARRTGLKPTLDARLDHTKETYREAGVKLACDEEVSGRVSALLAERVPRYLNVKARVFADERGTMYKVFLTLVPQAGSMGPAYESWSRGVLGVIDAFIAHTLESAEPSLPDSLPYNPQPYNGPMGTPLPITISLDFKKTEVLEGREREGDVVETVSHAIARRILEDLYPQGTRLRLDLGVIQSLPRPAPNVPWPTVF